ncbi:MAG: hypothetical protein IT436_07200 [Phycisphaerales bacterium]|nr:hypothetical protein [Phycisphaerales bacterium]
MPPNSTATPPRPTPRSAVSSAGSSGSAALRFVAGPLESDALVELFLVPQEAAATAPIREADAKPAASARADGPGAAAPEVVVRAAMKVSPVSDDAGRVAASATRSQRIDEPAECHTETRPGSLLSCFRGVQPLGVDCPYAQGVELGIDAEGVLHAAAWNGRDGDGRAVSEVLTTARWAREHAALLAKLAVAADLVAGPARAEVVAHLLTDEAARLRWLGDAGIRLHLAVRAGAGWTAASL